MALITVGIDVGTTGLKAVAIDDDARMVAEYAVRYPTRLAAQAAEQQSDAWWDAAVQALTAITAGRPEVRCVAVTSQGPTLVAIDRHDAALGPALTWIDRRATAEADEIGDLLDLPPDQRWTADPFFGTAKLLWWQRQGTLDDAATVVCANSFIALRLTGERSFDQSSAGFFTGWDGEFAPALSHHGVPVGLLGPVSACDDVVGVVSAEAAAVTGLPAGTPVAAGGIDAVGAALEAGLHHPGDGVVEMTGFSTVTVQPVPRGLRVPGMIHTRHCLPDVDLLLTAQVSTGAVVDWAARLCGFASAELLDAEVPDRRPGRLALLPSFAGERTPSWDVSARGAIVGLDLDVTPGDLLLAVFEGTAAMLGDDLEAVGRAVPWTGALTLAGGGARSRHWPQIKADVLGRAVQIAAAGHGAAYGAAMLAGVAAKHWTYADIKATGRAVTATYTPDADRHAAYRARQPLLRALRTDVRTLTQVLASGPGRKGA